MKPPAPPPRRPLVLRQAWMMTLADGSRHDHGHSFHQKVEDLVAYVTEVLETHDPDFQAEPIGEAQWVHVTEEQHKLIQATRNGLRVS